MIYSKKNETKASSIQGIKYLYLVSGKRNRIDERKRKLTENTKERTNANLVHYLIIA